MSTMINASAPIAMPMNASSFNKNFECPVKAKKEDGKKKPKHSSKFSKADDHPKRPLSAYNFFFQITRDRLVSGNDSLEFTQEQVDQTRNFAAARDKSHRRTHGKIGFKELAHTIGNRWKALDPKYKDMFLKRAQRERQRYDRELEVWKRQKQMGASQASFHNFMMIDSSNAPKSFVSTSDIGGDLKSKAGNLYSLLCQDLEARNQQCQQQQQQQPSFQPSTIPYQPMSLFQFQASSAQYAIDSWDQAAPQQPNSQHSTFQPQPPTASLLEQASNVLDDDDLEPLSCQATTVFDDDDEDELFLAMESTQMVSTESSSIGSVFGEEDLSFLDSI